MKNDGWLCYAGKHVIVSGCHSGIGRATAQQLCALGAQVHGFDWKPCDLALASYTPVDLRDAANIDAAVSGLTVRIDALFNCAGVPPGALPLEVMKVNYIGTKYLTDSLVPVMGHGSAIVNVASTGGIGWPALLSEIQQLVALDGYAPGEKWCNAHSPVVADGYRFSKAVLIVWTMAHSALLIKQGIRMNCTVPGAVQTPMLAEIEKTTPTAVIDQVAQPIGRRSSADEQAKALLFLNSPQASYINGVVLPVDGGFIATTAIQ